MRYFIIILFLSNFSSCIENLDNYCQIERDKYFELVNPSVEVGGGTALLKVVVVLVIGGAIGLLFFEMFKGTKFHSPILITLNVVLIIGFLIRRVTKK